MVDLAGWVASLDALVESIAGRFGRVEPRARVGAYLRGLLAGLERKNGWTLAEYAGAISPDGMQRLLRTAGWDVDGVRDDLRGYVLEQLWDPAGVFVIDETGFIKKGIRSAGVQRQYTGTSGKIDNCQLGVLLAYASPRGRALIDRELYLPKFWIDDRDRCARSGIGAEVGFATKPEQGVAMLARVHEAGILTGWVTADEAYGQNPGFRDWLSDHQVPFVLATRSDDLLTCPDGRRYQANNLAAFAGNGAWERRSAGPGAHGERLYDWIILTLDPTGMPEDWRSWLLVRRQIDPPPGKQPELAFYRCAGPAATPMPELIRVAGARWAIEECFQTAKNEAGLDHYQVRDYRAWYAHITLAMLATAYLAATRAQEAEKGDLQPSPTA
ncbi:MAG: IS701 family transposase [Actinobacteria bacterium]|nr:IS701 family transposase [Actinomycetota bacterium]